MVRRQINEEKDMILEEKTEVTVAWVAQPKTHLSNWGPCANAEE